MTSRIDLRRIGGEFEIGRSELAFDRTIAASLPTFGAPYESWLDTGRSALAVVASHLRNVAPQATVWLPAYSCESIVAPFLHQGLRTRFYAVGPHLDRVDADPERGDTLLFIHYFGVRNQMALQRIEEFRERGVRLIEDCVQAALTGGVGQSGDYALTSLRKILPQPDGALLASRAALTAVADTADEAFVSARVIGKLLRGAGSPVESFLALFDESEARLASDHPRAMSWVSRRLLLQTDLSEVAMRRRANFAMLHRSLCSLATSRGIVPLLGPLDDGEVPLGCPIVVAAGQRDALRRHLAAQEIFCAVHWDLAHVGDAQFTDEQALASSILTLPIDQRYDDSDMATVLDSLSTFCGAHV